MNDDNIKAASMNEYMRHTGQLHDDKINYSSDWLLMDTTNGQEHSVYVIFANGSGINGSKKNSIVLTASPSPFVLIQKLQGIL